MISFWSGLARRLERGEGDDTKSIELLRFCSGENLVFVVELSRVFVYFFLIAARTTQKKLDA